MIYHFEELSFRILTIERFCHCPGLFEVSGRPYAALSFRASGWGHFRMANRSLVSDEGSVLFVPANTPYTVEYSVSESIVVHFECCNYTTPEVWQVENSYRLAAFFQNLLDTWRERHSVNGAKAMLFDLFDKTEAAHRSHPEHTLFSDCVRYLDENFYDSELRIEQIYSAKFISASTLQRLFLHHLGMSPKQYLTKLRLDRALSLLTEGNASVRTIAFACGFSDEKYFSRLFRKKYGCPPSQIRSNIIV